MGLFEDFLGKVRSSHQKDKKRRNNAEGPSEPRGAKKNRETASESGPQSNSKKISATPRAGAPQSKPKPRESILDREDKNYYVMLFTQHGLARRGSPRKGKKLTAEELIRNMPGIKNTELAREILELASEGKMYKLARKKGEDKKEIDRLIKQLSEAQPKPKSKGRVLAEFGEAIKEVTLEALPKKEEEGPKGRDSIVRQPERKQVKQKPVQETAESKQALQETQSPVATKESSGLEKQLSGKGKTSDTGMLASDDSKIEVPKFKSLTEIWEELEKEDKKPKTAKQADEKTVVARETGVLRPVETNPPKQSAAAREGMRIVTDFDKIFAFISEQGKAGFGEISRELGIDRRKVEEWCNLLQEHGQIKIVYPAFGDPIAEIPDYQKKNSAAKKQKKQW